VNLYVTIGATARPLAGRDRGHRVEFFTGLLPASWIMVTPCRRAALCGRELLSIKLECWEFLQAKHATSVAIVDREDRAVRAMLGVLEPSGDPVAAHDTANCVDALLSLG
jgi:hypothetical protein